MHMVLVFVPFETPVVDLESGAGTPLNGPLRSQICFLALEFATVAFKIHLGAKNPYEVKRRNTF